MPTGLFPDIDTYTKQVIQRVNAVYSYCSSVASCKQAQRCESLIFLNFIAIYIFRQMEILWRLETGLEVLECLE